MLKITSKLWVDDFRDAPDDSWVEARKVEAAIRLISIYGFDVISLDHDIENRPDDETFKPVAYYIAALYQKHKGNPDKQKVPVVNIHSINPVGAKDMAIILKHGADIDATINPYKP